MKRFFFVLALLLITTFSTSTAQWSWTIQFDGGWGLDQLSIDTVSNPQNSWQIGPPNKPVFSSAYSSPNVIVTGTDSTYPVNDTSVFYIKHWRDPFSPFHIFVLHFQYQFDGDSLADFGHFDISGDDGAHWIDPFTEDAVYQFSWGFGKPVLTGNSGSWKEVMLDMSSWSSEWGNFPYPVSSDTILFRFTFISDSVQTNRDGWMMDNFLIEDWWEGLEEQNTNDFIRVYPNPVRDFLNVELKEGFNLGKDAMDLQLYSTEGKLVKESSGMKGGTISLKDLPSGIYFLKAQAGEKHSLKKILKE